MFKAVVNESFFSALEVRVLTSSQIRRLKAARGLLLGQLYGKRGYGAVAGEPEHRSVPVEVSASSSLRVQLCVLLRLEL